MNQTNTELVRRVARALVDTVPAVNRALRAAVASRMTDGLTLAQYRALAHLKDGRPRTLKELSDREGVEPPTMSRTVEALVDRGLVLRTSAQDDRRCVHLDLSERGTTLVDSIRAEVARGVEAALVPWPQTDLETLGTALDLLGASALDPRTTGGTR